MQYIRILITTGILLCFTRIAQSESPTEIYQRRIIPLLQSSSASSCSECHLQGVNLSDFLTTDPKQTFANLRSRGWIDIDNPTDSKLLQFLEKKPDEPNELIELVRKAEREAIGQWIEASVRDPDLLNTPLPALNDLKFDDSFIRHGRKDLVLARFVDVIWSQLERCANCHSPERNAKQVEKNGSQMSWIVPNSPSETLQLLEERRLVDVENPEASLLRTKALGLDDHGGGVKFPSGGHTDREWERFLRDYSAIKTARYASSSELPSFHSIRTWRTGLHLRIKDLPQLRSGQYAVLLLHRIQSDESIDQDPIAIGEGRVSADGSSWSSTFMVLEPTKTAISESESNWNAPLRDGRYQLRWIVTGESLPALEQVLTMPSIAFVDIDSLWKPGHSSAKTIPFGEFQAK